MHDKLARRDRPDVVSFDRALMQEDELRYDPFLPVGREFERPGSLADYWHVLSRRRWTILTVVIILTTLTAIASFKMTSIYKAAARIEVEADTPQLQTLNELYQQLPSDQDFLRTQIQVLQTDNLAWRTIMQLGLDRNPSFVPLKPSAAEGSVNIDRDKMKLIRAFKSSLGVELVPGSRVILVSFESSDPVLAAKVANSLVANYIDYNFEEKYDVTRQAAGRMEKQLDELKAKVEKSEQDLVEYQRQHSIVDVSDKQSVVEQRLAELSTQLTTAQSDRIQKESLYNQMRANPKTVAVLAQNELLQRLEEKLADIKQQYVEASAQYGPAFPKVKRLREQVDEYQSGIDRERNRVVERIRSDYTAAVNRESLLVQAVEKQKTELGKFNTLLVQQNILKGEYESNQQLYQRLLQHLKDATVSAGLRSSNIHLVDPALAPMDPIRPKKLLNIVLAMLVALIVGVSAAFVQESLDHSIKGPEDVESLVALPMLASIPANRLPRVRSLILENGHQLEKSALKNGNLGLVVLDQPSSQLAEAFRALRTSMLLSVAARPPQIILVTSASPGEGKSTTALNLAVALAQDRGEVLVIDCDLRRPTVARILGVDNKKGVSTLLSGAGTIEDAMQISSHLPNLWVLPSGPIPPNPAELLSSPRLQEILRDLRPRFRHIILDSPPLLQVTDATILSTLTDGVIFIIESGVTPRKALLRSCKTLQSARAKVLGIVVNKVDTRFDGYYGYYKGGYAYEATEPLDPPRSSA